MNVFKLYGNLFEFFSNVETFFLMWICSSFFSPKLWKHYFLMQCGKILYCEFVLIFPTKCWIYLKIFSDKFTLKFTQNIPLFSPFCFQTMFQYKQCLFQQPHHHNIRIHIITQPISLFPLFPPFSYPGFSASGYCSWNSSGPITPTISYLFVFLLNLQKCPQNLAISSIISAK